jgi:hypothetical protein
MQMIKKLAIVAVMLLATMAGCAGRAAPLQSPVDFLADYGIPVEPKPEVFRVRVPASWAVPLGAFPEGLYWGIAAELSREAGLDITPLKGKEVDVYRYSFTDQQPGQWEGIIHVPSSAVVLLSGGKVAGAWLALNRSDIGPAVTRRTLEQITGLTFDQWVERQGYFKDPGPNADLATLGPGEVLAAFLDAVSKGDKRRANACLSPATLRGALTMNLPPGRLYTNTTLADAIVKGRLLSYEMVEPESPWAEITEIGDRTRVELAARVEIYWRMHEFNTPNGQTTRFAVMEKGPYGWKLSSLGTGP